MPGTSKDRISDENLKKHRVGSYESYGCAALLLADFGDFVPVIPEASLDSETMAYSTKTGASLE